MSCGRVAMALCALSVLATVVECAPERISVGAIRWDGWFRDNSWQKNLQPEQWHYRLPFYGKVGADGKVECVEDSQEVMDQEILYAAAGGLDYWAFCYYYPKSWDGADAYNYGWRRYLASKNRARLNFCLNLQWGHLGPRAEWPQTAAQFVKLFQEPTYQKVCDGRPLVYIFNWDYLEKQWGSREEGKRAFDELRTASVKAGAGNPYIVVQWWPGPASPKYLEDLGFDALGAYSAPAGEGHKEYPYADLGGANRYYWDTFKATGKKVVPLVNAGWDGRPRDYKGAWYAMPKPGELAANLLGAIQWIADNPTVADARTALMYAWNETDEGGWLVPTKAEGTARLDAIAEALKGARR